MADVSRPRRRPLRSVGLVLLVAGLAVLGYVGWEMYGTDVVSRHRSDQVTRATIRAWHDDVPAPALGLLRVPRFGKDYRVPIVRGVDADALARGVGWYPQGATVGGIGNFVIAGHRVTHGEPFRRFPTLRKGDTVSIETRTAIFTYRLRNAGQAITVDFTTAWPLWPVPSPDARGRTPTKRLITLLTCSELFHTDNRNVVVGDLVSRVAKRG
jgi:sortase A